MVVAELVVVSAALDFIEDYGIDCDRGVETAGFGRPVHFWNGGCVCGGWFFVYG